MIEIDWVEIPKGEFYLGLSEAQITDMRERIRKGEGLERSIDRKSRIRSVEASLQRKKPQRVVWLDTFYIARFPVTCQQCDAFFAAYPELIDRRIRPKKDAPDFPEGAPWHIADLFCHWVGGRLPMATEWEKAARGTDQRLYPWGNEWDPSRGNFTGQHGPGWKTPVDAYPTGASPYGVFDMVGNVVEWTMTITTRHRANTEGPVVKSNQVKGSSPPYWYYNTVTWYNVLPLYDYSDFIGFRPVKDKWHNKYWQGFQVPRRVEE